MLIDICGVDGSGKSTQAFLLKRRIESELKRECIVFHSFKNRKCSQELIDIASKNGLDYYSLPSDLRTMSYLIDAMLNLNELISSHLNKKYIIIFEKYYIDTIIYGPLMGANKMIIEQFCQIFPKADITFFLDVSPDIALKRVMERETKEKKKIALKENYEYVCKARQSFINYYYSQKNKTNLILIDGEMKMETINNLIFDICIESVFKEDMKVM